MGNALSPGTASAQTHISLLRQRTESLAPVSRAQLSATLARFANPTATPADYDVLEELFYASLRAGDVKLAERARSVISARFPAKEFPRTRRLEGLLAEARGDLETATAIAESLIKTSEESDVAARKRLVVLKTALGRRAEAIGLLTGYLDTFPADLEGWHMLASLYLEEGLFAQAQYAAEETVLLDPHNHLPHIRLAEILYTRGDLPTAVKYYCRALELCPDTPRALYGLKRSTARLLGDGKRTDGEDAKWTELNALANERLGVLYGKVGVNAAVEMGQKWGSR